MLDLQTGLHWYSCCCCKVAAFSPLLRRRGHLDQALHVLFAYLKWYQPISWAWLRRHGAIVWQILLPEMRRESYCWCVQSCTTRCTWSQEASLFTKDGLLGWTKQVLKFHGSWIPGFCSAYIASYQL
jgi:hypothetical protein